MGSPRHILAHLPAAFALAVSFLRIACIIDGGI
jgi:hypothetical protein